MYQYVASNSKKTDSDKVLIRTLRYYIFGIILPLLCIIIPIHLRYNVFTKQLYTLSVSDMRVLDKGISTVWCQKQAIYLNTTTFNAYLLNDQPQLSTNPKKTILFRRLQLDNNVKQYWGFYLLKGSVILVSSCSRLYDSSLIVISGYKHLQQCMSELNKRENVLKKQFLSNIEHNTKHSSEDLDPQLIEKLHDGNRKKGIDIDKMSDKDKIVYEAILKKLRIIQNQNKLDKIDEIIDSYLKKNQKREINNEQFNKNFSDDSDENDSDENNSSEELDDKEFNLNCSGLILNQPLIPKNQCSVNMNYSNSEFEKISQINRIKYSVPKTGYYFFLLKNNDQIRLNDIVIKFEIDRVVYDLSNTIRYYNNVTNDYWKIPLKFFSNEQIVLEIPYHVENNNSIYLFDRDHDFLVWSDCEPRASIYIILFFSVIMLIILFAFN